MATILSKTAPLINASTVRMLPTLDATLIFLNKDHKVQEWGFGDFVMVLLFDVTISYCC